MTFNTNHFRFFILFYYIVALVVDSAPCQSAEPKCMDAGLEVLRQLKGESSTNIFDVLGTTCSSDSIRLLSLRQIENRNEDEKPMCEETFSNEDPGCGIRVVCTRLSSGIVQESGPVGIIRNAWNSLDLAARERRRESARNSCACEFSWTKSRHDWAVLVHGGQCDWFGRGYGTPYHYAPPTHKRKRQDSGMEKGLLKMHQVLTERFNWDPQRIIVFSCSEMITSTIGSRGAYSVLSDYSGPCNNWRNLHTLLHKGTHHCKSSCSDKDGNGPYKEPDSSFKPTVQCGCSRCNVKKKQILPGENVLMYIRAHGGRGVQEDGKRQITFVELYTHEDTRSSDKFMFRDSMIHEPLKSNTIKTLLIDSCYSAGLVSGELAEIYNSAKEHAHVHIERIRDGGKEDRTRVGVDFLGHQDGDLVNRGQIVITSSAEHCVAKRLGRWENPFTESILQSLGVVDAKSDDVLTEYSNVGSLYHVMNRMKTNKFMPFAFGDVDMLHSSDVGLWLFEGPSSTGSSSSSSSISSSSGSGGGGGDGGDGGVKLWKPASLDEVSTFVRSE